MSTGIYYINSHIDGQEVQDDDELERELEALLAPQKGRAPYTTKLSTGGAYEHCEDPEYRVSAYNMHLTTLCITSDDVEEELSRQLTTLSLGTGMFSDKVKFTEVRVALQRHEAYRCREEGLQYLM